MPECRSIDRRMFLAGSLATLAAPAFASGGSLFSGGAGRRSTVLPWTEVAGGKAFVTDVTKVPGGNVLAVPGKGGTFVVDAKFTWVGELLRKDAGSLTSGGGVALLNTHHHADHTSGNVAFSPDVPIYAHPNAKQRVLAQHQRYLSEGAGVVRAAAESGLGEEALLAADRITKTIQGKPAEAWAPTVLVDGLESEIEHAGQRFHAHHFGPGHTDNDLVFHAPELNLIHTGDLVFNGLFPFCDQNAGVSIRGWIGSLWKIIEKCDARTVVVAGHGPVGDRSILHAQIRYFENLLDAVASDMDAGLSRDEVAGKTYPFMEGLGFGQIRPFSLRTAYDEISGAR